MQELKLTHLLGIQNIYCQLYKLKYFQVQVYWTNDNLLKDRFQDNYKQEVQLQKAIHNLQKLGNQFPHTMEDLLFVKKNNFEMHKRPLFYKQVSLLFVKNNNL